jgi:hypothetical protein
MQPEKLMKGTLSAKRRGIGAESCDDKKLFCEMEKEECRVIDIHESENM